LYAFIRRVVLVLAVVIPALVMGARRPAVVKRQQMNLLLILVDTLRADHLGCYGYRRPTSPHIDRLASESVVFERAYSHSPWTMPSVGSLFTSLEPKDHGIATWKQPLDERLLTLAEHLRAHGYRTEGYVSHGVLAPLYNFDQGFDVYDSSVVDGRMPRKVSTAREVTDLALSALDRMPSSPFFLWLHYFDPHNEYMPHEGFAFGDGALDRYDGEIAYTDQQIGRLLEAFRRRGLLERTIVVLMADHGEGFLEHGHIYHSTTLYDELLHIPLILHVPGALPQRASFVAAGIDVAPTLVSLLGLPIPQSFRGRPLRLVDGRFQDPGDVPVVAESRWDVDLRAIRTGRWKLIVDRAGGARKLFDLDTDPRERRNLRKRHPEMVQRLEMALDAHYASSSTTAPERALPPEVEERLKSLGYVN
jgi:arylsulfatase A-like enzyme